MNNVPPSRAARLASGLSFEEIKRRARVSRNYLLQCERSQDFPLVLAERLAQLYRCDLNLFRRFSTGNAGRRSAVGVGVRSKPRPLGGKR